MKSWGKTGAAFKGDFIGKEIIFLETTTSTNDAAAEIARKSEDPEGIVVIADAQTRGRGRLGRTWLSPPGVNLYFTVLLKPPFPPAAAASLTLMSAVAVADAVREHTGLKAEIKWPNDIYINGKKAGGILLEMKTGKNIINLVSVGIGLNVNMPLNVLPDDIRPSATSLKEENRGTVDRIGLLEIILAGMERYYKILLNGDKGVLISEWIRLNCTLGHKVLAKKQDRVITGTAEAINDRGELIVRVAGGGTETLNAEEVTINAVTH